MNHDGCVLHCKNTLPLVFKGSGYDLTNHMIFNDSVHRWEKEGAEGWGYQNCLPYFKKAQCHAHGEDQVIFSLIFLGTFPRTAKKLKTSTMMSYENENFTLK